MVNSINTLNLVDYSRQAEMDSDLSRVGSKSDSTHLVIGCGGVGYWLAINLAMLGHRNFTLIDGDKLESTNLARLPVPQTWIGTNKAVALRKLLRFLRPDCVISCISTHATDTTLLMMKKQLTDRYRCMIVWDTTDDARSQRLIYDTITNMRHDAKSKNPLYRKIGYEGWKVGNYQEMAGVWGVGEDYEAGYRTTKANALSSNLAATMGILSQALNIDDITLDVMKVLRDNASTKKEDTTDE